MYYWFWRKYCTYSARPLLPVSNFVSILGRNNSVYVSFSHTVFATLLALPIKPLSDACFALFSVLLATVSRISSPLLYYTFSTSCYLALALQFSTYSPTTIPSIRIINHTYLHRIPPARMYLHEHANTYVDGSSSGFPKPLRLRHLVKARHGRSPQGLVHPP